jgi:hypothetical protein
VAQTLAQQAEILAECQARYRLQTLRTLVENAVGQGARPFREDVLRIILEVADLEAAEQAARAGPSGAGTSAAGTLGGMAPPHPAAC